MKEIAYHLLRKYIASIWLFPGILALILIILTVLQIHGSSIGMYHQVFYGGQKDKDLIANHPQSIRSDEYSVNSQMAIAQGHNNFEEINDKLGNGEDMTILSDAPYRGWSIIFHPENVGFFVLPFDNAFALRWWIPSFLLVLGAYLFILKLLPGKKLLAALLSSSFLLSPFFQWWYITGTLASVYYCLFGILVFTRIFESKTLKNTILWSLLLCYLAVSFALLIYPPFQISCALVTLAFTAGYLVNNKSTLSEKLPKQKLLILLAAVIVSVATVGLFLGQRLHAIQAIQNTAYPGQRVTESGGTSAERFFSSNLSSILQFGDRYRGLEGKEGNSVNQSELSSFLLITPLLIIPTFYFLYKDRHRKKRRDYTIATLLAISVLFMLWLFMPGLELLGRITLLDKVLVQRLVVGVGLLNFMFIVVFIKQLTKSEVKLPTSVVTIYSLLIFICYLLLNFHILVHYPGFIGYKSAVILAIPFALIVFLLLKGWFVPAAFVLFVFSIASSGLVNPLYKGTEVLTQSDVSRAIRQINAEDPKKWAGDENYLENFALMNGVSSLSGTYLYPQIDLWSQIDPQAKQEDIYNRYAHVNFAFDRDEKKDIKTYFYRPNTDLFYIILEPCAAFLKDNDVGYLMTRTPFNKGEAPCTELKKVIKYPEMSIYIYKLAF